MAAPSILVLHGVTMSGASMLRVLGPLRVGLESEGFQLIAPDAPNVMDEEQVGVLLRRLSKGYTRLGQDPTADFARGAFWEGDRRDWFASTTDPETHARHFAGLHASFERLRDVTAGENVVGILGFSQGCAMAALAAGVARRGGLPFGESLRFGIFLAGFKPKFDSPVLDLPAWPIGDLPCFFAVGAEDAIFPDPATLRALADEVDHPEVHVIEGLRHLPPTAPGDVQRIVAFARTHGA